MNEFTKFAKFKSIEKSEIICISIMPKSFRNETWISRSAQAKWHQIKSFTRYRIYIHTVEVFESRVIDGTRTIVRITEDNTKFEWKTNLLTGKY